SAGLFQWRPAAQVAYHVHEAGEIVPLDFTETAAKVTSAVVHIRSTRSRPTSQRDTQYFNPFRDFFGPDWMPPMNRGPQQSTGSGVIINSNGYIVTNNHVVQDAEIVEVTLYDNRSFKAEIVGTDPDTDIALLKIEQKDLPYLAFVDSDQA